jgi:hypothetical protein
LFAATFALTVGVVLMGLAMSIRPRAPQPDAGPARRR